MTDSKDGVTPWLLIMERKVKLAKFKKQLRALSKDLAKCDRKG